MKLAAALLLSAALALPGASHAQQADAETLADLRQELSVLFVEFQRLQRELSTTGAAGGETLPASVLERVDVMEQQLQSLTSRAEELQFRVDRVVTDGTNRVGDLEFRICELEPGCDISEVGETLTIGGGDMPATGGGAPAFGGNAIGAGDIASPIDGGSGAASGADSGGAQLAVGEQQDFDRAKEALDSGSFRSAADLFATFTQTYPGGPLNAQANYYRGEALAGLGDTAPAARAYLESFSADPGSSVAPQALLSLGQSLSSLGQNQEACVTLGEVGTRFPGSDAAAEAASARDAAGCF
ncbi:tol-pal system protein YbgF [Roseicyclus sp. F158]|uniref:Cell division coordinator CpoB n=1 Tax=Tropicimonas omnivorans TaxID=3075590 RepID=A0ABU3DHT9_9RHOB|nr:tol-pal system protein YbgF [Roseicyclus sp. F158]MDT0683290.1 tol-pal system protein YbgF [Roseicyclus sp. F158]